MSFSLGGVRFDMDADDESTTQLPATFAPFLCGRTEGQAGARFRVLDPTASIEQPGPDCSVVWTCPTWRMVRDPDGRLFIQIRIVPDEDLLTVAISELDFSAGVILRRAGRKGAATPYALHYPCDQALIINRLAFFHSVVLHSCGVAHDGRILLFCGPSGIGKTTIARLWRGAGATLLNDDRMLVRRGEGGIMASATPWHGEERVIRPDILPLGAIFFLHQDAANRMSPTGPAEALSLLLANTIAPFYLPDIIGQVTSTWSRVLQSVPAFHFHFTPGPEAIEVCRSYLCSTAS